MLSHRKTCKKQTVVFESPHNALQAMEARHVCQWIVSLVDSFDSGHKILYIVFVLNLE